jgi:hypothetical protein
VKLGERLQELWDNVRDPYWRLDHPEVTVLILSVVSGLVGLVFTYLRILLERSASGVAIEP